MQVILEAKADACLECLVPDSLIVQMLEDAIRQHDPSLVRVELSRRALKTSLNTESRALGMSSRFTSIFQLGADFLGTSHVRTTWVLIYALHAGFASLGVADIWGDV